MGFTKAMYSFAPHHYFRKDVITLDYYWKKDKHSLRLPQRQPDYFLQTGETQRRIGSAFWYYCFCRKSDRRVWILLCKKCKSKWRKSKNLFPGHLSKRAHSRVFALCNGRNFVHSLKNLKSKKAYKEKNVFLMFSFKLFYCFFVKFLLYLVVFMCACSSVG